MDQTASDLHAAASAALVVHVQAFDALREADERNLSQGIVYSEDFMVEYNRLVLAERETNQAHRDAQQAYQDYIRTNRKD